MKNKGYCLKIFVISAAVLISLTTLVHVYALTSSYFSSNSKSLLKSFLACGDENVSGENWTVDYDNGTEIAYNETEEAVNETVGSDNKTSEIENVALVPGQINGMVFSSLDDSSISTSESSDASYNPLENATVAIMYIENKSQGINIIENITDNNSRIWKATLTDENGSYLFDLLTPGSYEIRASKQGYLESVKKVALDSGKYIKLDFVLEKTSSQNYSPSENMTKIIEATKTGLVGGEINVWQENNSTYDHEILIYDSVNITKLDVVKGIVSFTVSGNENSTGKTISVNVDSNVFNSDNELRVEYDGELIKMADDINDVLNPNNDGSNPEYLITRGGNGIQILVSIPHFSTHEITVFGFTQEIIESLGGINAIALYISISVVASIVFIGTVYIRRKI